jgi:uncharacterized protein YjbI with pentapeptide repeats
MYTIALKYTRFFLFLCETTLGQSRSWNLVCDGADYRQIDLSGATGYGKDLSGRDLTGSNLDNARLDGFSAEIVEAGTCEAFSRTQRTHRGNAGRYRCFTVLGVAALLPRPASTTQDRTHPSALSLRMAVDLLHFPCDFWGSENAQLEMSNRSPLFSNRKTMVGASLH